MLITRATPDAFEAVRQAVPEARYNETARVIVAGPEPGGAPPRPGVLVVAAGTSDLPVAEEAAVTAEVMGNGVERLWDVGVAGVHRLLERLPLLHEARVLVVVAGMEGALPSLVGGLVSAPVIAVPTSVGYGASFQGLAALLAMLNACSPGIAVVNIDNGFGAGYMAATINLAAHGVSGEENDPELAEPTDDRRRLACALRLTEVRLDERDDVLNLLVGERQDWHGVGREADLDPQVGLTDGLRHECLIDNRAAAVLELSGTVPHSPFHVGPTISEPSQLWQAMQPWLVAISLPISGSPSPTRRRAAVGGEGSVASGIELPTLPWVPPRRRRGGRGSGGSRGRCWYWWGLLPRRRTPVRWLRSAKLQLSEPKPASRCLLRNMDLIWAHRELRPSVPAQA